MRCLDSAAACRKYLRETVNRAESALRVEVAREDKAF